MKVTFKTTLEDILKIKKGSEILQQNGVPCLSCPLASQELGVLTIGEVSQIYNLNLDKILDQLNQQK
ncbi:MAG: DUF1858 domain-containing protein [Patescibacteria group bacterium]|nr:DUF1858 domain-containing protein [Patescibacteria group bacterium]